MTQDTVLATHKGIDLTVSDFTEAVRLTLLDRYGSDLEMLVEIAAIDQKELSKEVAATAMARARAKRVTDKQVKEACLNAHSGSPLARMTIFELMDIADVDYDTAYWKLYDCDERSLVNYGVSLRTCWWDGE